MPVRVLLLVACAVLLTSLFARPALAAPRLMLSAIPAQFQLDLDRELAPGYEVGEGVVKGGAILLIIGAAVAVGGAAIAIAGKVAMDWGNAAAAGPILVGIGVGMVVGGVVVALVGVVLLATQIGDMAADKPAPAWRLPRRRPLHMAQPQGPAPLLAFSF
jgi:hypothetical protein